MVQEKDYERAFFECSPLARFAMKVEGTGNYTLYNSNDKARSAFRDPRAKLGTVLDDLFDPEIASFFWQAFEAALRENGPVTLRIPSSIPGLLSPPSYLAVPVKMDDGSVFFDVTVLPAASADASSLQRERDDALSLLTSVFDVSEVGIIVTDRHQRVVRINDSFVRIYGWTREDLVGQEFTIIVAPEERDRARGNHEEFMRSGIRTSGEMRMIRKNGSVANGLFTTAALELSHGRRFQVTTIMDITLRKQMEMNLRLAKEQADAANQAKSTFLANMSHELRTPLNAIIGFSEMMMKETFGPLANARYKDYMGDIHLSARHLLEIINEVLDMSKIEAGRVELDEQHFDVHQLITAVVRMMDSRAFSSGLRILEHVAPDLPPLYADHRLIRQVLINLVGNAVKYSNSGGMIDVSAARTPDGVLRIEVKDTGMGIPKDRIQEALEPFGQVNKSAESGGIQGTGLGLPLAKAMTEMHGGHLTLDSDVGKGTTVTVELPAWRLGTGQGQDNPVPISPVGQIIRKAKQK